METGAMDGMNAAIQVKTAVATIPRPVPDHVSQAARTRPVAVMAVAVHVAAVRMG